MTRKVAPLNASFMLTAILGLLISIFYVRKISPTWAFAFGLVFVIMIISALISMIQAPARGQLMPKLEKEFREEKSTIRLLKEKPSKIKAKKKARKKKR